MSDPLAAVAYLMGLSGDKRKTNGDETVADVGCCRQQFLLLAKEKSLHFRLLFAFFLSLSFFTMANSLPSFVGEAVPKTAREAKKSCTYRCKPGNEGGEKPPKPFIIAREMR